MDAAFEFFTAAGAGLIPVGGCKTLEVDGRRLVLAHLSDGYYAIENRCSHAGSPLAADRLYHGRQIACPVHGARFDIKTGAAKSPPAFRAIATFATRIVDGRVEVALPVAPVPDA
jgi:3-phenylpropionate/trans-cinnamate dioxygenase ferredoxin subunit